MITWRRLLAASVVFGAGMLVLSYLVATNGTPLGGEASLQRDVQTWDWFETIALVVNNAGDGNTWIMFLLPVPAWLISKAAPGRKEATELLWLAVLLAFFALWNPVIKEILDSPRPSAEFGIEIDRVRDSYGFPSGHVSSGILLFGSIAAFTWRYASPPVTLAVATLAAAMIVLSGPARIYAGAHWPSDTLGGYLSGAALFCLTWAIFLGTIGPLQVPKTSAAVDGAAALPPPSVAATPPPGSGAKKKKRR